MACSTSTLLLGIEVPGSLCRCDRLELVLLYCSSCLSVVVVVVVSVVVASEVTKRLGLWMLWMVCLISDHRAIFGSLVPIALCRL